VVPTCRCQREREGGGLLVVLGRRPDGWAGGLLGCAAVRGCRAGRLARWAAERCWAGGAVAGCQAGLGRCAGRWVGLEGGKGLREIGFGILGI
jgi:hypothetical protein